MSLHPSLRLRALPSLLALALASTLGTGWPAAAQEGCSHEVTDEVVTSQADATEIAITVFRPCTATAADPVPVVLHGHGWSGSRETSGFEEWLDAGLAMVSIDQRGHGDSGGQANVMDPDLEAQDVKSVIDYLAAEDWVRKDVDAQGVAIADDPVLFAIGGSYGGGYQMMTALTEVRESGRTRFNALAPEITWFDLSHSLAPNGVPRSEWGALLMAVGLAFVDMAPFIPEAFAYAASTGQWPDGRVLDVDDPTDTVPDHARTYRRHSPVSFVAQGLRLDIPVIWRQGINDGLFPLNEGISNFTKTLTQQARDRSIFVGYNGGHVLPSAYPLTTSGGADACSPGGFAALSREFFLAAAGGADDPSAALTTAHPELARYNLTQNDDSGCVRLDRLPDLRRIAVGTDLTPPITDGWMTLTGPAPAVHIEIPDVEPGSTIAGIPRLSADAAVVGVDQRAFWGLSVGTSPADAQLLASNVMPLRLSAPSMAITHRVDMELAGVTHTLAEGERLYLTVSGASDQFAAHISRAPGWMGFVNLQVALPIVEGS
jgi:ABC-2 type transport system ATP-binding protein